MLSERINKSARPFFDDTTRVSESRNGRRRHRLFVRLSIEFWRIHVRIKYKLSMDSGLPVQYKFMRQYEFMHGITAMHCMHGNTTEIISCAVYRILCID